MYHEAQYECDRCHQRESMSRDVRASGYTVPPGWVDLYGLTISHAFDDMQRPCLCSECAPELRAWIDKGTVA